MSDVMWLGSAVNALRWRPARWFGAGLLICLALVGVIWAQADAPQRGPAPVASPVPAANEVATAPVVSQEGAELALTIYSTANPMSFAPTSPPLEDLGVDHLPGYAVVRDTRAIDLAAGENTIKFADVAAGIDPTTVSFQSLTDPQGSHILEQNYQYDVVSPDKLLQKYVGKEIIINRKASTADAGQPQVETLQGTLLSYDADLIVLQTRNRQLPLQMIPRSAGISEIKLFDLQTGLVTKPTLVWKIAAKQAGANKAQLTYQTDGITWRADYNMVLNKGNSAVDVGAWVSILNESGAAYPNCKLKLVAGDVHRLISAPIVGANPGDANAWADDHGFQEHPFFEYHTYALPRTTSIANNSTKQIELFPPHSGVGAQTTYVYRGATTPAAAFNSNANDFTEADYGTASRKTVELYLKVTNSQKNGLGIPLPPGRVRIYKRDDPDGMQEFVGENIINHTPKDESLRLRIGSAFDVVGGRKQTEFTHQPDSRLITESYEITLRNHKDQAIEVNIKEPLYRTTNWEILKCSDKYEKVNLNEIDIPVSVKPNEEKTVTYQVKYSW